MVRFPSVFNRWIIFICIHIYICIYTNIYVYIYVYIHRYLHTYLTTLVLATLRGCGILVPWPGTEPAPLAVKAWSPNHRCMLSRFSHILRPCATPWTAACQAPLSMGFSRQEYWSELPFPSLGDLPDAGIKPPSPPSPALACLFTTSTTCEENPES